MSFLRLYNISRLSYLLALILVLPLAACSGGDGGLLGGSSIVTLNWEAPTERVDNTPLNSEDIKGFRIYYGFEKGVYQDPIVIDDPVATQAQITGIPSGVYFVVITTIDIEGRESSWSTPELEVSI